MRLLMMTFILLNHVIKLLDLVGKFGDIRRVRIFALCFS